MKRHFSGDYDYIINATDQDREGSFLFYELYDHLKCKLPVERFYPNDLTANYLRNNILTNFEDSAYDRRM
jgi:DNA topoisomerase IA